MNTTATKYYTKIFKFFIEIPLHAHTNTPLQQTPQFKNPKKKLTKLIANDYKIVSLSFDFISASFWNTTRPTFRSSLMEHAIKILLPF